MSVKNTPISRSKLCTNNSKESTPVSLRKQIISKSISSNKSTSGIPIPADKSGGNDSAFNNAFSLPSSASRTPASTPKFRQAPTALNACYTPSSLYKSAASTPVNHHRNKITTPKTSTRKIYNNSSQKTPECFSRVTVETPRRSAKSRGDELKTKDGEISNLSVAVRVRPLNAPECLNSSVTNIVQVDGNEVVVLVGTSADSSAGVSHSFQYDHVFWSSNSDDRNYADQAAVFNGTGLNLVDKAFEGYNACLFAYGQTGSGKSYSMMGIETDDVEMNSEAGIIPRFCHELFKRIDSIKDNVQAEIEVSYFEIYNEKIHDLLSVVQIDGCLNNNGRKNALKVREHPVWGPYVVDLSLHPVDSYQSLRNWLAVGNSQRATAATGMNEKSSRSHSIFNIILNLSEMDKSSLSPRKIKQTKRSKISLVDLAGSERISHTSATGERIREGVSINKSLLTLGKVIAALADSKKGAAANFVPYRESVLTWLLRESLGGNSKTVMLATISPASIHLDETLATLRYACQARTIVNRVKVNEDPHDRVIRELRAEVERLQALRQDYERQKRHSANGPPRKIIIETSVDDSEVESLRMQLAETERELTKAQKSWMERLQEAENLRKSEMRLLRRKGLALELSAEQKQACLVNLAADPILSGILFYILPPGTVRIGRSRPSAFPQPDIVLEGPLVAFNHCSIENTSGKLFIVPENEDFETYLNGELLNDRQQMYHGDRLVIGGSHYFRISNPNCSRKHKNILVDYQLAHQEILQKQEEQLRRELDEEKKAALSQIELERAANERNYRERIEQLELEKFKYKCSKELLETEKKALEDRDNKETKFEYTPYKSTLLDDIQRIMQNPTEDSLHKTQLKVKEATQRCRDLGARLEFKQSQVLDEFGIFRAVVIILDKDNKRKAEWPTARLDVWLDILRENDVTKDNLFKCVDIEWEPYTQNLDDTLNDSLNSSRISLNLNSVKEAILKHKPSSTFENCKNIFKNFQDSQKKDNLNKTAIINSSSKKFENTKKMLTYEDEENSPPPAEGGGGGGGHSTKCKDKKEFCTSAYLYLKDMQRATLKFKKLCDNYSSNRNTNDRRHSVDDFKKSIEQIEGIIYDIKATLTEQKLAESPTKTPKSVRFLLD